jgi:hypothetical protein
VIVVIVFFAVVWVVFTALALVWVGYQLAVDKLHDDRAAVEQQQAALAAEWQQLDQTRRVRSVFLTARRAMQAEAERDVRLSREREDTR